MLRRAACLLVLLVVCAEVVKAQRTIEEGPRQPRILLLLDGSSSMLQPWNNTIRFKAAAKVVSALMDSIYAVNAGVEFGLRVYGHQSPAQNNDCFDSRMEVMFSKNNTTQMDLRLASLRPYGVSPIAYSLRQAAENDLADEIHNAYSVILITDGGESCGGNICEVVKNLIERKITFKPYILSLVNYTPLKEQYACLGTYLQVANEAEMGPAINKIVEAYRPMLTMPIMTMRNVSAATPEPTAKPVTITIPAWVPDRTSVATLSITLPKTSGLPVSHSSRPNPRQVLVPRPNPVPKPEPEPTRAPQPALAIIRPNSRLVPLRTQRPGPAPRKVHVPLPAVVKRDTTPISRPVMSLAAIRPNSRLLPLRVQRTTPVPHKVYIPLPALVKRDTTPISRPVMSLAAIRSNSRLLPLRVQASGYAPRRVAVPPPPRIARSIPEPVVTPPVVKKDTVAAVKPTPAATQPRTDTARTSVVIKKIDAAATPPAKPKATPRPADNQPKEASFTSEREDSKETTLSILFTDGRGKFYASTPQLQLMDAVTGKQVKQFYRTVDAAGNPDPQAVPPGTYNLLVAGRANMLMRRIVVEKDKNNKIIVKVSHGSLRFRYEDAPDRPVIEFDAIVNIRFEPGPTVKQRCTAELEYPPGNYYIEINTMPVSRFNTDIDFGAITEIQIPQPGYVQFTNQTPLGSISLYTPLGNKFVRFYGLRITGNPANQRLQLRPGLYEVHWVKNPSLPFASETIERFTVKSNSVTEVELR